MIVLRDGVETGTVRKRRRVQIGVALVEEVDVGEVRVAHRHQIPVAQRRPFGAAGGAAGEEDPGRIVGRRGQRRKRVGREERLVIAAPGGDHGQSRPARDGVGKPRRDEDPPRLRLLDDPLHLLGMKTGVDGDGAESRAPAAEQDFEELGTVLEVEDDALSRDDPFSQRTAEADDTARQLRISRRCCFGGHGGPVGKPARDLQHLCGDVHGCRGQSVIAAKPCR